MSITTRERSMHPDIRTFDEARSAGLSVATSLRWVRYLAMKAEQHMPPITLAEAVQQKRHAIEAARVPAA